jgi:hypothetical protein
MDDHWMRLDLPLTAPGPNEPAPPAPPA